MSNKYIIADIKFNHPVAAKDAGKTIEEYNQMIIENWNSVVQQDDLVFVFGVFGIGRGAELKPIIEQLNGKIYLMSYPDNRHFKPDRWRRLGIDRVWNVNLVRTDRENESILMPISEKYKKDEYTYYCLSEKYGMTEVYKNNCLNINLKYWDYTPINYDEVWDIIDRLKVFEEMEDNNENK